MAAYLNQENVTRKVMAPKAKSREFEFTGLKNKKWEKYYNQ